MNFNYNEQQRLFIESNEKFIRLLAPAGCGKTFSLIERCRRILKSNPKDKILLFTFTRVARDEIKDRIGEDAELSKLQRQIRVDTLNRYGYNYLKNTEALGLSLRTSKADKYFTLNNSLKKVWSKNQHIARIFSSKIRYISLDIFNLMDSLKSLGFRHDYPSKKDLNKAYEDHLEWIKASGLKRYYQKNIVDILEKHGLQKNQSQPWGSFLSFWQNATQEMWDQMQISFEDQKYWALLTLENKYKSTKPIHLNQYQHIFVDEFQDINPLDLNLVKELVRINESSLVIVGDDDQAIYEWRGSTPTFILNPDKHFNKKFKTFNLGINYRSPENIVQTSQNLISNNKNRVLKEVHSESSISNAEIEIREFENQYAYLNYIRELAQSINQQEARSLAILSRVKAQLIPIQIMLASDEISFYAKEDLNVLVSKAFSELKDILSVLANVNSRKPYFEIVDIILRFADLVKRFKLKKQNRQLLKTHLLSARPRNLYDALLSLQDYRGPLKGRNEDGRMSYEFYESIYSVIKSSNVSEAISNMELNLLGLEKNYLKSDDDIFFKDPPFAFLLEYADRYGDDYWGFIDHVEDAIAKMSDVSNDDDKLDPEIKSPIHLMTALRAKGKEFKHVVVLDVNQGIWPHKLNDTEAEHEQERRVFYVAITRAQERLTLISTNSMAGKTTFPSQFIEELSLS